MEASVEIVITAMITTINTNHGYLACLRHAPAYVDGESGRAKPGTPVLTQQHILARVVQAFDPSVCCVCRDFVTSPQMDGSGFRLGLAQHVPCSCLGCAWGATSWGEASTSILPTSRKQSQPAGESLQAFQQDLACYQLQGENL